MRREQDGERLDQARIEPVILDINRGEDIARLAARVDSSGKRLHAIVNNAGMAANAPVETLPLDDWRAVFDVNVFGAVALTQALLPALRRDRGRVVNISSIGGKVAMPAFGAYSGSKFALEAISDALRQEVAPHGVQVVIVEPGGMRTEMGARGTAAAKAQLERMTPQQREAYSGTMRAFLGYAAALDHTGLTADKAARTVASAITTPRPRTRYTIGREAAFLSRLVRFTPDRVLDRMIAQTLRSQSKDTATAAA
ncbi:short-chain dehydrogenase/reductase [Microbacterium album]|uniref:Short-chain dehydrogenase/reductase n=1 Tax=Microbacterium album TaxID=2053191 RepID=A0A917IFQ0_9MICO|nr:short-chain dehydrogenase/reductase [Microbacterium album]